VEFTFKSIVIPLKTLLLVYVGTFQTIGTIGIEGLHCTRKTTKKHWKVVKTQSFELTWVLDIKNTPIFYRHIQNP